MIYTYQWTVGAEKVGLARGRSGLHHGDAGVDHVDLLVGSELRRRLLSGHLRVHGWRFDDQWRALDLHRRLAVERVAHHWSLPVLRDPVALTSWNV